MSRRQRRRFDSSFEEPPINMTPLIDVVFVILIMFIVIAPLLDVDRIQLAAGTAQNEKAAQKDHNPVIRVYADNTIKLNGQKIQAPQLRPLLTTARKTYPGARPQVFHDKRAAFGTYQAVKNAVEEAGFEEMDIVLSPGSS